MQLLPQGLLLRHTFVHTPPSMCEAYSTDEVVPSFVLLAVQGPKVVVYLYELHGDSVDVSKSEFTAQPK